MTHPSESEEGEVSVIGFLMHVDTGPLPLADIVMGEMIETDIQVIGGIGAHSEEELPQDTAEVAAGTTGRGVLYQGAPFGTVADGTVVVLLFAKVDLP